METPITTTYEVCNFDGTTLFELGEEVLLIRISLAGQWYIESLDGQRRSWVFPVAVGLD